jgi:hypothetical protein
MGKALLGTHTSPTTLQLLDEVRALRARVAELERALSDAEAARAARSDEVEVVTVDTVTLEEPEPVGS